MQRRHQMSQWQLTDKSVLIVLIIGGDIQIRCDVARRGAYPPLVVTNINQNLSIFMKKTISTKQNFNSL